jgi:Zn-finger protein
MGASLKFQHRNPTALPVQGSPIYFVAPRCTKCHRIHEDIQMNTVLGEIKKWSVKHLSKLGNYTKIEKILSLNSTRQT